MKDTCRYAQSLGKMWFLILMAAACAAPSIAQQDLQIMVSGPWSYVADTANDTLYLVAPGNSKHELYIYPGLNAVKWIPKSPLPAHPPKALDNGTYVFTLDKNFQPGKVPKSNIKEQPLFCDGIVANTSTVTSNTNKSNYVISLPMPDQFSTFADLSSSLDGYSESKVSLDYAASSVTPALYTTLMVLHYGTKSVPTQLLLGGQPFGTSDLDGGSPAGITIVAGDLDNPMGNQYCDNMSMASIEERNGLWGIKQQALFPEELDMQGHQTHHYSDCSDPSKMRKMTVADEKKICFKSGYKWDDKNNFCVTSAEAPIATHVR